MIEVKGLEEENEEKIKQIARDLYKNFLAIISKENIGMIEGLGILCKLLCLHLTTSEMMHMPKKAFKRILRPLRQAIDAEIEEIDKL